MRALSRVLRPRIGLTPTEIFARGENLLDEEYEEVFGFGVPGAAGYIGASISF